MSKWNHTAFAYKHFHNSRIAVFGPSYIWTGELIQETEEAVTLKNVNQLFETGSHSSVESEREKICEVMTFPKTAICSIGDPIWTADAFEEKGAE